MDESSRTESNSITLRIKFKSASLEEFTRRYGADVSPGGIFIKTKQPLEVGATLQFEFSLADGSPLLFGGGTVAWIRENDPTRTNNIPGMGLRFDFLTPESQLVHQKILGEKNKLAERSNASPVPPTQKQVTPATAALPLKPLTSGGEVANLMSTALFAESSDFSSGAKTELSKFPLNELINTAETASVHAEGGVPSGTFGEEKTKGEDEMLSPPPEPESVVAVDLGSDGLNEAQGLSGMPGSPTVASPSNGGGEVNEENIVELSAQTLSEGVPQEAVLEKTIETPLSAVLSEKKPEGGKEKKPEGMRGFSMPPTPSPVEKEGAPPALNPALLPKKLPRPGRWLWISAACGAIFAFGAVYLIKTKPWETASPKASLEKIAQFSPPPEEAPVVAKAPPLALPPAPANPALEKALPPAAEPVPAAKPAETPVGTEPKAAPTVAGSPKPVVKAVDSYRWLLRSVPANAEVFIDGEYFCRTPCDRRVLEPEKPAILMFRKTGFEPFERSLGPTENWTKKGKDNVLVVFTKLVRSKAAKPASGAIGATKEPAGIEPAPLAAPSEGSATIKPKIEPAPVVEEKPKAEPAPPPKAETKEAPKPEAPEKPKLKPTPSFE